ncbi:MAG: B12-binding domain-containing radical SAM protein [Myxococcota bacterium]|nr:B12-binding domain-containing radical SAM protein [Myxococcota bacterium]
MGWQLPNKNENVILIVPPTFWVEAKVLLYSHKLFAYPFLIHRLFDWLSSISKTATLIDCLRDKKTRLLPAGPRTAGPHSARPLPVACWYIGLLRADLIEKLRAAGKPDQVWITSTFTFDQEGIVDVIKLVREVYPDVPIILGGTYPSFFPEAAKRMGADHVHAGLIRQAEDHMGTSIDTSGLAMASRGCPNACSFCGFHMVENLKFMHPVDRILAEVDRLIADDISLIVPYFSNIFAGRHARAAEQLFQALGERDVSFLLWTGLEITAVTPKRARLLRRAGCLDILVPLQTLNPAILAEWGRRGSTATYRDAVAMFKDAGFDNEQIGTDVLIGHPDQSLEEVIRSLCFVWSQGVSPLLLTYTSVPGSKDEKKWTHRIAGIPIESRHPFLFPLADPTYPASDFRQLFVLSRVLPEHIETALGYLDPDSPVPGMIERGLNEFGFDIPQRSIGADLPSKLVDRTTAFLSFSWELVLTLLELGSTAAALPLVDRCERVPVCESRYLEVPRLFFEANEVDAAVRTLQFTAKWLPPSKRTQVLEILGNSDETVASRFLAAVPIVTRALDAWGHSREASAWQQLLPGYDKAVSS